jgi:hypothetical protein
MYVQPLPAASKVDACLQLNLQAVSSLSACSPSLLPVTFNAYDVDGNGRLDREEIQGLCHTVCNKDPLFPGQSRSAN